MTEPKKDKRVIDWDAVKTQYGLGTRSLMDIGKEFGVSDAGIIKRAKKDGWTKDLGAKVRAKADAKVSAAAVSAEVSVARAANEQTVVEANSELQYKIRIAHRTDIARGRKLFQKLMDELESTTDNKALFDQLGELLDTSGPDENGRMVVDKLNEIYRKVIGMTGRVDSAKKLVEILEKVVKMEREAFGIDSEDKGASPIDQLLMRIARERSAA